MKAPRPAAMIEARDLTKRFGRAVAVDGISFEVPAGEIFAFLGPNGAGKTTTIRMLTTLLRPTSGTVIIDGMDANGRTNEVRKRIGIVFQETTLDLTLTAWETVDLHGLLYRIPRARRHDRTEMLLREFGLWERRAERVQHFSGGMKRRLEIARGLLHAPRVLFLDEPTLGLDPQSRNQLWTFVKLLNATEGVTVFLTTHHLDEADRVASRIAVIDRGRIIAAASPEELKRSTARDSLEEAFLLLTGVGIREDSVA